MKIIESSYLKYLINSKIFSIITNDQKKKKYFNNFYKNKDPWNVEKTYNEKKIKINKLILKYQKKKTLELGCGRGEFDKIF